MGQVPRFLFGNDFEKKKAGRTFLPGPRTFVEPTTGFEPVTCALRERCSTS